MTHSTGPPTGIARSTIPPRLLIIGCGYLGGRVADVMLSGGWSVIATTRSDQKASDLRQRRILPLVADISRREPTDASLPHCDAVLWAVGFDHAAESDRATVWVQGIRNVIERLDADHPPSTFCLVSSISVYGNRDGREVDELATPDPATPSGDACLQTETTARELLQARMPDARCVILRLGGIYGPGRLLRRTQDLQANAPLVGTGVEWLNLIHVDDAAGIVQSVILNAETPPLINVVSPLSVTRAGYYGVLAELTGAATPRFQGAQTSDPGLTSVISQEAESKSRRQSSGNKRVVSRYRDQVPFVSRFDDVRQGLTHALTHVEQREPSGRPD